ncbi:MAG TPA: HIT family protein [Patescibacteria group bacterium]|nr:HIT family protein [Patescibacteria group bacterium]
MKKSDCIFCQIVEGKAPCHKVWEDDTHIAFLSIFPNTDGFTVVATKEHYPSYAFENDDEVLKNLIVATKKVAQKIDQAYQDVGRTGMFFEGFGVDHLHSKLFPMHGTGDMKKWKPIESKDPVYYAQYPGFLSSQEGKREDDGKLAVTARKIKESL